MTSIFRGRHSALEVYMFTLRGMRAALDVSCCVVFASRIVRAASSGENVQIPWQVWGIVRESFCVVGAACGEHPPCVECHFAWQAQYLGHFRDCNCAFRIGTAARGVMLPTSFVPFCVAWAVLGDALV